MSLLFLCFPLSTKHMHSVFRWAWKFDFCFPQVFSPFFNCVCILFEGWGFAVRRAQSCVLWSFRNAHLYSLFCIETPRVRGWASNIVLRRMRLKPLLVHSSLQVTSRHGCTHSRKLRKCKKMLRCERLLFRVPGLCHTTLSLL